MKLLFGKCIALVVLVFSTIALPAQQSFQGSFLMTFSSSQNKTEQTAPILWCVKGSRTVIEIHDAAQKSGTSQRVLFDPIDSTWTMILESFNIKNAAKVHAAALFRDTAKIEIIKIKSTTETKSISGFMCKKIIIESKKNVAQLWITDQVNFNLCYIYKILEHCGLMGEYLRNGDWYLWKNKKGMLMELSSRNKVSGKSYTMTITQVKPGNIDNKLFSLKDFSMVEIHEGQHCGNSTIQK